MHTAVRGGRKDALVSATVTAVVSSILLAAGPGPADAPAHLYRALLVRDGALVWDNLWFAGQYPLASYSLLYYLPAAVVGNLPLVLGAAIASTLLFSTVARREFGDAALWPSRAFAVLAAAPMFTGLYAYSVGFAFMLAALAALQRGRRGTTVILAAVTLGASPLAFGFLVLVLVSFALSRRVSPRAAAVVGIPVVALAGLQFAVTRVFRSDGMYPFHTVNLVGLLAVCTAGGLLAARTPRGRPIVLLFTLWAAGSVMLFLIPTPFGDNWTRMSAFVFPVALLTASLARWQPRWLSILAVSGALAYNIAPYALLVPLRLDTRAQTETFWAPALTFLRANRSPDYRIEIVPTASHWESYLFPRDGYAIARGWYQQLDMTSNGVLYESGLTAAGYRRWLRGRGVRYVVLPRTRLDTVAAREGQLLSGGASGLDLVLRAPTLDVFELRQPTPILTGPPGARVRALGHTRLIGSVQTPGRYLLRVRYVPYYRVRPAGCIGEAPAGLSWLVVPQAGRFVVDVPQSLGSLWHGATRDARTCGRANEEQASTDATPRAAASATAIASERRSPNVVISSPSSP